MARLVSIRSMGVLDGCVEVPEGPRPASPSAADPPTWTSLSGEAEGDDGRRYSWRIVTAAVLGEHRGDDHDGPNLLRLPDLVAVPLRLTDGDDDVTVVVEAPHFGPEVLDALQYGPAWLRARVFQPMLTEAEQAWLDRL